MADFDIPPGKTRQPGADRPRAHRDQNVSRHFAPHQRPIAISVQGHPDGQSETECGCPYFDNGDFGELHLTPQERLMLDGQSAPQETAGNGYRDHDQPGFVVKPGDQKRGRGDQHHNRQTEESIDPEELADLFVIDDFVLNGRRGEAKILEAFGNRGDGDYHADQPEVFGYQDTG
jgi:hypothetical protein